MLGHIFSKTPAISTDAQKIDELLTRSVVDVIEKKNLRDALQSGRRLRVKLGIDPTSPHLHLGRSVPLLKLRDFQDLGHQIVFIIGDFTGVIGDTSDKESERPMLDPKAVAENAETYFKQAGKLLDMGAAEVRRNSEWLSKLSYAEIGNHADQFSVSDFISRENIKKRLEEGKRVSLREVLYPLMQGYDSVAVRADVELGGMDQRFNLLAGRTLQERYGQAPQNILMNELIPGLDGRKMSSSWGNTINLTDEPADMYGKVMSLSDDLIVPYFTHVTRVPLPEVARIEKDLASGALHPKTAKMKLAHAITTLYHGAAAAQGAETAFEQAFSQGKMPDSIPPTMVRPGTSYLEALMSTGKLASRSELRRLSAQHAVMSVSSGALIEDLGQKIEKDDDVRVGKKIFVRIRLDV